MTAASTPIDTRIMRWLANLGFALAAAALLYAALQWAANRGAFSIARLRVTGELIHTNPITLRSYALGGVRGTFFTLDLMGAKRTFESVPWVRKAVVRRLWPNGISVEITEHHPVALMLSAGQEKLVNQQGELFEANALDIDEELPRFVGPIGASGKMLSFFERLNAELERHGVRVTSLQLDARSEWMAETDDSYTLLLGRDDGELWQRVDRFVSTQEQTRARLAESATALGGQWSRVDLRHKMGYAVALGRERSIIDSDATNTIVNTSPKEESKR